MLDAPAVFAQLVSQGQIADKHADAEAKANAKLLINLRAHDKGYAEWCGPRTPPTLT